MIAARHRATNKRVAIKVLFKTDAQDGAEIPEVSDSADVCHEVALFAKLGRSEFSARFIDHFKEGNYTYLVTKLMESEALDHFLWRRQVSPLTEKEIRKPLVQVVKALQAIHDLGYIHNDVHPSNLFISVKAGKLTVKLGGLGRCTPVSSLVSVPNRLPHQRKLPMIPEPVLSTASDVW